MIRPRTREEIEDARRGLSSIAAWNDRHDVVGLSPGNWISPIDFTPIGWINKGRKAVKAAKVGYRLGRRGLTTFGRAAYREARRHAAGAGTSLIGKGARRYVSLQQSSGSSSRAYQQNGSPGGTSSLSEKAAAYGGLAYLGYKYATEDMYKLPLSSRKCRPGFVKKKIGGKWMCVRKHSRKK